MIGFMDGSSLGWFIDEDLGASPALSLPDGLAPGSNEALPENSEIYEDSSLGNEFRIDRINGLIEGGAEDRKVVARWVGLNCIFR